MVRTRPRSAPLIPLTDTNGFAMVMATFVFVVLTIMMLAQGDVTGQQIQSVDMAKVHHATVMPSADREDAVVIVVTRDARVYVGSDAARPDELPAILRQRLTESVERKVYLEVDARAPYAVVSQVLAEVRSADVRRIAFLVEKGQALSPPPPVP